MESLKFYRIIALLNGSILLFCNHFDYKKDSIT